MNPTTVSEPIGKVIEKLINKGMCSCVALIATFLAFQQSLPEGEKMFYMNQEEMGKNVANGIFAANIIFQIVVAMTQSGKTGCMSALIKYCIESEENKIPAEHIFIITGISSKEWVAQTRGRIPVNEKQIAHRNDLKKLAKTLKGKENILIIVDEVHIACGKKMSINKMLKELGYKDTEILKKKNINFVEFSATPGAVLKDHKEWRDEGKGAIHYMEPGEGYKGPRELLNGRSFQWKRLDFEGEDREKSIQAIEEIKMKIEETYSSPKFHIIRAPKAEKFELVKDRFMSVFIKKEEDRNNYDFISCHSQEEQSIDEILRNGAYLKKSPNDFPPPLKHTFIFIKETMRCAYTIGPKQNVGILYERFTNSPQEHVVVQGMAGRACGYNVPDDMIVYTDIEKLESYKKDWDAHFEDIKHYTKKETAYSRSTFGNNSADNVDYSPVDDHKVMKFTTFEEVVEFLKDTSTKRWESDVDGVVVIGGPIRAPRGPNKLKTSDDGFIRCKVRGNEKVWSTSEMKKETRCNIKNKAGYKINVCYEDEQKPETVQYWVCWSPEHIKKIHPTRFIDLK